MSHKDAGNYGAKHTALNPAPAKVLKLLEAHDSSMSCSEAHDIAGEFGVPPATVGAAVDEAELKITRCQLGLFGHEAGKRIIVQPAENVPDLLKDRLLAESPENRIPCDSLWKIADDMNLSKMEMTAACENLRIKIETCQLGAF